MLSRRIDDPGVLAAPALRGVDHQRALAQRHARQAAGGHLDLAVREDERAQVEVARLDAAVDEGRRGGQADDRLRDVVARIRPDQLGELRALALAWTVGPISMP